jgi:hypothetical protein
MRSLSAFVFSFRKRLPKKKKPKIAISLGVLFLVAAIAFGPAIYRESWLDPFSTLNVPNRILHPRAIDRLGMINANDPLNPLYYADEGKIQELMRNLQRSTLLSDSEQANLDLENQEVKYFTLHRKPTQYHAEEDYALQYYPKIGIVRFGQQFFRINESSVYALSQIMDGMTPGWWE